MSQWTVETFVPPMFGKPVPSARWTVPSIFSSKSVFRMWRVMPGLQPIPSSPSLRAPSSVSSVSRRYSSSESAEASTIRPASKRRRIPLTSRPP